MDYVRDVNELLRRMRAFAFGPDAPAELAAKLQILPGTAADQLTDAGNLLYAYRDQLGPAGLVLLGEIFEHARHQGWSSFCADGRCDRIVKGARRDLGEKGRWPSPGSDPLPDERLRADRYNWHPSAATEEAARAGTP